MKHMVFRCIPLPKEVLKVIKTASQPFLFFARWRRRSFLAALLGFSAMSLLAIWA